jgi:hypothetical protein
MANKKPLPVKTHLIEGLKITPEISGKRRHTKTSYPVRYGRFAEIETNRYIYQFNLNGEIKHIKGKSGHWPHPAEWLKRTLANDWVYYSTGSYNDVHALTGEYYLPCPSYPSNGVRGGAPFEYGEVKAAFKFWRRLQMLLPELAQKPQPRNTAALLNRICKNLDFDLKKRSCRLHNILGGRLSVLPPDTRHVDYDVVPIMVADGCLYDCGFCRVKSGRPFNRRTKNAILDQIKKLKYFLGDDLANYNAIFLGDHDALNAGAELIEYAATTAYKMLSIEQAHLYGAYLFLFGSVDSLLKADKLLFEMLNKLPFYTYINIGLESVDKATLKQLGKPLTPDRVIKTFERMNAINNQYPNLEITANFVLNQTLSENHFTSLRHLLYNHLDRVYSKGAIYLSPMTTNGSGRDLVKSFFTLKKSSRLPTYLYLIQRL